MARRRRRAWVAAIVGNALLVVVLVGGPWLRGRQRALEAREAFGRLAACLWDAEPDPRHGLTLPADDLAAYADASRDAQWPRRCLEATRFDLDPAFWLFPETRVAEADVVRATRLVAEEIESAPLRATVASRPRLAVLRLSAALAVYSERADAFVDLDAPAIRLSEAESILPERIPLQAGPNAELDVYAHADGVELVALDARGLSWVRVRGGRVDARRLRRPSTLRATVRDRRTSHLMWWTDPERCAPDCTRRALGWAALDDSVVLLPQPRWLGAHPVSDDAVAVQGESLWVVAAGDPPELRRFDLEVDDVDPGDADAPHPNDAPDAPAERTPLEGAEQPALDGESVWWTHEGVLHSHRDGRTRTHGAGRGWVQRAGSWVWAESGELLYDGHRVAHQRPSGTSRLVGRDARAWLLAHHEGTLAVSACELDGCGAWLDVRDEVVAWDATVDGERALVAWVLVDDPAIRVQGIDRELGEIAIPSPCFDTDVLTGEPSGMCGAPRFGSQGDRVFLVAREGTDAWIIERESGPWRPLTGLR